MRNVGWYTDLNIILDICKRRLPTMKYTAPVAELVSVESVSALLTSGDCCGDAVHNKTVDEEL